MREQMLAMLVEFGECAGETALSLCAQADDDSPAVPRPDDEPERLCTVDELDEARLGELETFPQFLHRG
jgi:hypothetical protein